MPSKTTGNIRVGIGGWTFEPWRGTFYPKDLPQKRELQYAGQHLTAIEINGTYYGSQKPESFARWRAETPKGFVFSVKGPRFATNRGKLAEAGSSIERFFASGVTELKEKLGKEKMEARAEELRTLFQEGLNAGKSFEDMAKEQKVALVTPPPFRLNEPPRQQEDIGALIEAALYLKVGGLSQRVDTPDGAMIVYLKQREAANQDVWLTEKENTVNGLQSSLGYQFLYNWFTASREAAKFDPNVAATAAAKRG